VLMQRCLPPAWPREKKKGLKQGKENSRETNGYKGLLFAIPCRFLCAQRKERALEKKKKGQLGPDHAFNRFHAPPPWAGRQERRKREEGFQSTRKSGPSTHEIHNNHSSLNGSLKVEEKKKRGGGRKEKSNQGVAGRNSFLIFPPFEEKGKASKPPEPASG